MHLKQTPLGQAVLVQEATRSWWHPLGVLAALFLIAGALNSTLIYDDLYLVEHYRRIASQRSLFETLRTLFFIVDLEGHEYRLYGLSKILHFGIWEIAGARAWVYGALIAGTQFACGIGIYRILRRLNSELLQSWAIAATWVLSPFAVTSCFHHYSYLLLPCQITVVCALVLQQLQESGAVMWRWRLLVACLGCVLVTTGEAHLPATVVVLVLVVFCTPSKRLWRDRVLDLLILFSTMAIVMALHRWGWTLLTSGFQQTNHRYSFAIPSWRNAEAYTMGVLQSLPKGVSAQLGPLFALAGPWSIVTSAVVVMLAFWGKGLVERNIPHGSGWGLTVALGVILVASCTVIWALSTFTAQVSTVMPRRYGYVPYTIAAMFIVSLLSAPAVRRRLGQAPAFAALGTVAWAWLTLTAVCLPIVRVQDAKVWNAISTAMHQRHDPSVLFVNSWSQFDQPGFVMEVVSPGLRGRNFPDIFESPLSAYWWESQYAVAVLGARFAAFRFDDENASAVRLTGNGLNGRPPIVAPIASIVAVADLGLVPAEFPKSKNRFTVFKDWGEFWLSTAAHGGATIKTGWFPFLTPPGVDDVQIDLGDTSSIAPGVLPDKHFLDTWLSNKLITNYGLESGEDSLYGTGLRGPLSYFFSNRHGAYTYRVEFGDQRPKTVELDILEIWHDKAGFRPMSIDAAFDDRWFHAVKVLDPAEWAFNAPLSLKLYPGKAHTFRVRLAPAPGAVDIPFLNGIRVSLLSQ